MRIQRFRLSALLVFVFLTACEQASDQAISIPNVQISCSTSDDSKCSSSNPDGIPRAFVRMTRSGCGSSLEYDQVATGDVLLNCDGTGCDGVVTRWTNPGTLGPVNEILTGDMDICAQVDLNSSSGLPDAGDLISEDTATISDSSPLTVDSWSVQ